MNTQPSRLPSLRAAAALALLAGAGASHALDYTGYFRAGPGLTSANASRACYALGQGSSGMKYRLGNECDFYGEFQLSQGFQKDGIDYRATLMVNQYTPATQNAGDKGLNIEQMWAEAKGFDVAPDATFWIGKERGRRGDVHIVDTFFIEMLGVGAGFKGQPAGPGKLGVAFYKTDSDAVKPGCASRIEMSHSQPSRNVASDRRGQSRRAGLVHRRRGGSATQTPTVVKSVFSARPPQGRAVSAQMAQGAARWRTPA